MNLPGIQPERPNRVMIVVFTQDSGREGGLIMARLYREGWETLEPLQYSKCGHYHTTLYFPKSMGSPLYWRSCAEWPEGIVNNISGEGKNVTKDRHDTKEQAEGVCSQLRVQGFGGERCHFPLRTWVEPVFA